MGKGGLFVYIIEWGIKGLLIYIIVKEKGGWVCPAASLDTEVRGKNSLASSVD
jgi:hypothetical protein